MTSRFLALCRTSRLAAHPSPGNTSLSAAVKGRIRPCLRPRNRKRCVGPTVLSQRAPLPLTPPGRLLEARPHQAGPPTWWPLVRTRGQTWKTMPLGLGGGASGTLEEPRRDRFWPRLCAHKLGDPGQVASFSGAAFPVRTWRSRWCQGCRVGPEATARQPHSLGRSQPQLRHLPREQDGAAWIKGKFGQDGQEGPAGSEADRFT